MSSSSSTIGWISPLEFLMSNSNTTVFSVTGGQTDWPISQLEPSGVFVENALPSQARTVPDPTSIGATTILFNFADLSTSRGTIFVGADNAIKDSSNNPIKVNGDVNLGTNNTLFIKDGINTKIRIFLKYDIKGNAVITNIERVSKPGRRVYVNQNQLPRVLDGLGISILSTSKGVLSNKIAKRFGVGGEVICNVW